MRRVDRPTDLTAQRVPQVGGIFYNNYPGGSGLTSGAVFGRKTGISVAKSCR